MKPAPEVRPPHPTIVATAALHLIATPAGYLCHACHLHGGHNMHLIGGMVRRHITAHRNAGDTIPELDLERQP